MVDAKDPYSWELPPAIGDAPPMLGPAQGHHPDPPQAQEQRFREQDTDRPVVDVTNVINFDPGDYDADVVDDPYPVYPQAYPYAIQPIACGKVATR